MDEVPVIDIAPLATDRDDPGIDHVAWAIDRACRDLGFFVVSGHGVSISLLDDLDRAARTFFARSETEKADIAMARGGRAWRGWFPEGGELTSGRPDHKEGIYFGTELEADDPLVVAGTPLHGPNLFPAGVPELRPAVHAWMAAMTTLGHRLARGLAVGLGLDADWFHRHLTADPTVLFRIFRYPATPVDDPGWGVAEHTDYGLLTILAHDGQPGLEVHSRGWVPVVAPRDTFVVNLGDMLERMTGGRYRSTPHRVRHGAPADTRTADDRLSFPFFFDPAWDADVAPVPVRPTAVAAAEAGPPRNHDRQPTWDGHDVHGWSGTYGDYLTTKVARVFPDLGRDVL
ncbi:MAG: isopenicillin N synthase family dioxygenase [Acidimicrobiales bacterium]